MDRLFLKHWYFVSFHFKLPNLKLQYIKVRFHYVLIDINRLIQKYLNSQFIFKNLDYLDYCERCNHVFNKKGFEGKRLIEHKSYCLTCKNPVIESFYYNYKFGKYTYDPKHLRAIQDNYNSHPADYLQPTRWNNAERKQEVNPDFVKYYGDPFKRKDTTGKSVIEQMEQSVNNMNYEE